MLVASTKAFDSGNTIKASIEGEDASDFLLLRDGKVNGVASGEVRMAEDNLLGALNGRLVDRENLNSLEGEPCFTEKYKPRTRG